MICEADGPERDTGQTTIGPYRLPLDIMPVTTTGLFELDMNFPVTGDYLMDCYVANRGGVNARYFNNRWVEGDPAIVRTDASVDFNWGQGLVTAEASDFVSAQHSAFLKVPEAANYTFYVTVDDGAKLWLDDELVLSRDEAGEWSTQDRSSLQLRGSTASRFISTREQVSPGCASSGPTTKASAEL
ncbi:unnamed protein product [Prorocentrum cordatum]|uniref:PA14 domain-containing protein n=1 Tax=Prorocentrum cordatum TaxID=2364126 RepID=A0ABN9TCK6_9DINO|nr:unnamed protein product [Polarella glacialis]